MANQIPALSFFHPEIRDWFTQTLGAPTQVQTQAWPVIAAGNHTLITAPTGTGKTLAAFLWGLNQLITGTWQGGSPRLLYISPLKALNNDVQRNLLSPLIQLQQRFENKGLTFPAIRVLTRSGDTPAPERRQMLRRPPEILITTPESLNLLLSSQSGTTLLRDLKTVILDEIHAVVDNHRGTLLSTGLERLVLLSGEFQRVALSATVTPLELVAQFIAGYRMEGDVYNPVYHSRPVEIIQTTQRKKYDIQICVASHEADPDANDSVWNPMVQDFREIIDQNQSTLFFTNSRRLSEMITLKINHDSEQPVAYAHHGSLSREIRFDVEQRLKSGQLKAIVATQSLELGIDIGALDEVVMIQSPMSVASAIQRIGRAGHRVGEVSKARFYPTHDHDLLTSAVLARAVLDGHIESVHPVQNPLDVLAQIIIAMTGPEPWDLDALYAFVRTCWSFHTLSRHLFDLVIHMLAGRYANTRIRELSPRITVDHDQNTIQAKKGATLSLYTSGGVIPDRGYFHLRHQETGSAIGELDEEFVWEARAGQVFSLGTQNWRIQKITHNDVLVTPAKSGQLEAPFWIGEEFHRGSYFSEHLSEFLEMANESLNYSDFEEVLISGYCLSPEAAKKVITYLSRQKEVAQCDLPHRHHVLIEHIRCGPGGVPGNQIVLHTFWGGQVNKPFSIALEVAWKETFGYGIEIYPGNDTLVLVLPETVNQVDLLSLVTPENLDALLRKGLEKSGFFGARFRESAGRALILTRPTFKQRMPLWMTRLRSQKLMASVLAFDDFPLLLEAWRICFQDAFDLEKLRSVLREIGGGSIRISETTTAIPSPMATEISWRQINQYMYAGDEPKTDKTSQLATDLIREAALNQDLRPQIPPDVIRLFEEKRQRLYPGYTPSDARELADWIGERVLLSESEWEQLIDATIRDHGEEARVWIENVKGKVVRIQSEFMENPCLVLSARVREICQTFYADKSIQIDWLADGKPYSAIQEQNESDTTELVEASALLVEWFRFYGPKARESMLRTLGIDSEELNACADDSLDTDVWIEGSLVRGDGSTTLCDLENFEILLRIARSMARPAFQALPIEQLPLYLAFQQGLIASEKQSENKVSDSLLQLSCFSAPAHLWESQFLPARIPNYRTADLDALIQEGQIRWRGTGEKRAAFFAMHESDLLGIETPVLTGEDQAWLNHIFRDHLARYDFSALAQLSGSLPSDLVRKLWPLVWAGQIESDAFIPLRRGLLQKFKLPDLPERSARRHAGRSHFMKWKQSIPYSGNWYRASYFSEDDDSPIDREEKSKDRVRLLLDRYGLVFRELLMREDPLFQWKLVFRSLRLMELSGEVISGYFFEGISGPQFMSPKSFRELQPTLPEHVIYWLNATDPASCCGLGLDGLKQTLPSRVDSTHLVYRGSQLIVVSQRNAKKLTIQLLPDDLDLPEALTFIRVLLKREFDPMPRVVVETINDQHASDSPYLSVLKEHFQCSVDYRKCILYPDFH